ncbi:phage holin family protein [Candidatus Entotheonella palauensis]|nr:phage holin family protein [Candidatus Entotheonella palauensis]
MMLDLGLQWLLSAVSLTLISNFLPGFRLKNFGTALIVAGIYGVLHVLFSWLLKVIFFLPMFLTLGLFALIINAFLLFVTDKLVDDFEIDSLKDTLIGAVLLTVLNFVWRFLF